MKKVLVLAWFLAMSLLPLQAQVVARVEYPQRVDYIDRYTFTLKENGILRVGLSEDKVGDDRWLRYDYMDTNLKVIKYDSLKVNKKATLDNSLYKDGVMYLFYTNNSDEFYVFDFDVKTKKMNKKVGKIQEKGGIYDVTISGEYIVFNTQRKRISCLQTFNTKTGESNITEVHLKKVSDRKITILDNAVIDDEVFALVSDSKDTHLLRMDMKGNILGLDNLTENIPDRLFQLRFTKVDGNYYVTGTFSKSKKGAAQGIFFSKLKNWKLEGIQYYSFVSLKGFTEGFSDRSQAKIERRKEKAEKRGKEYVESYLCASHPLIKHGNELIFIGEFYYPTYVYTYAGNSMTTRFDGYQYTHALVAKFDLDGKLIWDKGFVMKPREKPFSVKHLISVASKQNTMQLMFADRNKLVSKQFDLRDGSVVADKNVEVAETGNEDESVKKGRNMQTLSWYDRYFLVIGNQTIKNKETGDRRKVFSMTKYEVK